MSKVTIAGDVNGTGVFTIAAPNGNTNRTLTLPDATGTVLTTATPGVPINGPAFSAYASASQSVTSGVDTKVVFNTEQFDTNNNFASNRFTPTVAGYYQLNTTVRFNGTTPSQYILYFFKNGSTALIGNFINTGILSPAILSASTLIYMNGSTDYVEVYMNMTATSPTVSSSAPNTSFFSGFLARAA